MDELVRARQALGELSLLEARTSGNYNVWRAMKLEAAVYAMLKALEEQAALQSTSERLSVVLAGTADRPSRLPSASQLSAPELSALMETTLAFFRSIGFIVPALTATFPDSSTLQLTLRWPGTSTEMPDIAGGPGAVAPDGVGYGNGVTTLGADSGGSGDKEKGVGR